MRLGARTSFSRQGGSPVLKRVLATGITAFVCTAAQGAHAAHDAAASATTWQKKTLVNLARRATYLDRVMHLPPAHVQPTATRRLQTAQTPRERAHILISAWRHVYEQTEAAYRNPPLLAALWCIHGGEGSWHDTRNPIYDGGLQMDYGFQARYGGFLLHLKGRAYNWTPLEQIWTAVYAISGPDHRGFYPWPMTARACHLI
jgi:hypothetical protein